MQENQPKYQTLPLPLFVAVLLFAIAAHITADMYAPSMPYIVTALHTDTPSIQLTLTTFMLGYSIMHLFYGPISDKVGRRKPLLAGLAISMVGTLFCIFASSVDVLLLGRLLQGAGLAACNALGRSLLRDLLSGSHLAKISSYLGMVMIFFIAVAPTLGGYIQYYFDWRMVFLFLLLFNSFVWLFSWKILPETNNYMNPEATKIKTIFRNYFTLLSDRCFIGYSICASCAYSGMIAYVTSTPFLMQSVIGLTPTQYGWLSFVTGTSIFISLFTNSRLIMKVGIEKMILMGIGIMGVSGLIMLLIALLGWMNVVVIMLPVVFVCIGAGFIFSNSPAGAFHHFPKMAGSAAGLYGFIQILGGVFSSSILSMLPEKSQAPLAMAYSILALIAFLAWKNLATRYSFAEVPADAQNR